MSEGANNPVGRLYGILSQAAQRSDNEKVYQVWARVLGVPQDDPGEIVFAIFQLVGLVRRAKRAVGSLGDGVNNLALYLQPFQKVERVFWVAGLRQSWKPCKELLNEGTLARLELAADLVSVAASEPVLTQDLLDELLEEVERLMDGVTSSELPQDLKSILLSQLETIKSAILSYRIGGTEQLVASLERAAGAVMVRMSRFRPFRGSPVMDEFWRLVAKGLAVAEILDRSQQLIDGVRGLLGTGGV